MSFNRPSESDRFCGGVPHRSLSRKQIGGQVHPHSDGAGGQFTLNSAKSVACWLFQHAQSFFLGLPSQEKGTDAEVGR